MFDHVKVEALGDFFKGLSGRKTKGVYFYRISGCNESIEGFIRQYYEAARKNGVIIEGRIPNPDNKNLAYYEEMMGMAFQMSPGFITDSLKKWLPRMNDYQRGTVSAAVYDCLDSLRKAGKNENMLKNAYIKFMCWLYYKFERIISRLGDNEVPKILYDGDIGSYELMLISILSNAGCDVILLEYHGDENYLKSDPGSKLSDLLVMGDMKPFPQGYSIKTLRDAIRESVNNERLYGQAPAHANCTNAWIDGKKLMDDLRTPVAVRGKDDRFFYNVFCRINGAWDKLTYVSELFQFANYITGTKRKLVVVNGEIPAATMEEIAGVNRKNSYQKTDDLLLDLSGNIKSPSNAEMERLIRKAFIDVMLPESKAPGMNIGRLLNKGVYLVCWLKRYIPGLFAGWKAPDVSCFIHFGPCRGENEALFLRLLARLPVDVVVFVPELNEKCILADPLLYEQNFPESLNVRKFPSQSTDLNIGTSAYHAEKELDTLLYQDTGLFRNQQYAKANAVTLKTMYEEIKLLWGEEVKYRPNFETVDGVVNIPVIFAKVSGVKDGKVDRYWDSIRELTQGDVFLVTEVPYVDITAPNPMKACSTEFYKNGRLLRSKIKAHRDYQYGFLREEMQEHILDKLQLMIEQKVIKGIGENGTEYTVIATVLNMNKALLRTLQSFDFTKKNPKLVYVNAGEKVITLEDSILMAFLNMVGFDIVFFIPTGYQSVEKFFNRKLFEEHQIGEYIYDLQLPDLKSPPVKKGGLLGSLFSGRR